MIQVEVTIENGCCTDVSVKDSDTDQPVAFELTINDIDMTYEA